LIPFDPPPQPRLDGRRVLITAGRHDPIAPTEMTLHLEAHFKEQGADCAIFWHEGGHEIRREELESAKAFLTG
jgi:phospholipase/carboxylesterase